MKGPATDHPTGNMMPPSHFSERIYMPLIPLPRQRADMPMSERYPKALRWVAFVASVTCSIGKGLSNPSADTEERAAHKRQ